MQSTDLRQRQRPNWDVIWSWVIQHEIHSWNIGSCKVSEEGFGDWAIMFIGTALQFVFNGLASFWYTEEDVSTAF